MNEPNIYFTGATVMSAEGARVAFITCLSCHVAILLDPRDEVDRGAEHLNWHREMDLPEGLRGTP